MPEYDVLIVEDDLALREALSDTLEIEGFRVITACNGTEALSKMAKHQFRLVVSDVQMPVMDGLELLRNIQHQDTQTPVLLMTAYGTIPKAVAAMQDGAVDYLIKPFEAQVLVDKVNGFIQLGVQPAANDQVVQDVGMQKLYAVIDKVARTDVTVLLQGESGCGKEVVAQYIHRHSLYQQGAFVALNCAAIPENMLEAMLFGYEKGAFTGATQSMPGKFELAQGGTLLLDEVSEMDLLLQAKLLRVLQEREVERLGSNRKISLNVRILATTNRHLKAHVELGRFREDLYYRLSVFPIEIPPLRQRIGDILPLANDLMQRHSETGKKLPQLTPQAIEKLRSYAWPGNVRELENVMQRALILHDNGKVTPDDLILESNASVMSGLVAPEIANYSTSYDYDALVQESVKLPVALGSFLDNGVRQVEEQIILQTLHEYQGSRKMTAQKLGISDRTLRYKIARMREAGISLPG